ncbi:hypothetical protein VTH06DRAFT_1562 [Thermothelomyces fergusii]
MPGPGSSGTEWPPRDKAWVWEGGRSFSKSAPPIAPAEIQKRRRGQKRQMREEKAPAREESAEERTALNEMRTLVAQDNNMVAWQGCRDGRGEPSPRQVRCGAHIGGGGQEDGDRHHGHIGNNEAKNEESASGREGKMAEGDGVHVQDLEMVEQNPNHGASPGNAIEHREDEQRRRVQRGRGDPRRSRLWDDAKQRGALSAVSRHTTTLEARRAPKQGRKGEKRPRVPRGGRPATTIPASSGEPARPSQMAVQGTQAPTECPTAHGCPPDRGGPPAIKEEPVVGVKPEPDEDDAMVSQYPALDEHRTAGSDGWAVGEIENASRRDSSPVAGFGEALGAVTEAPERGQQGGGAGHGIEDVIGGGPQGIVSREGPAPPEQQGTRAADGGEGNTA